MQTKKLNEIILREFEFEELIKQHEIAAIQTQIHYAKLLLKHLSSRSSFSRGGGRETPLQRYAQDDLGEDALIVPFDDTFVAMKCPSCHKADFLNMQGFVNHCRIRHEIECKSHVHAIKLYGTPVDISAHHPARASKPFFDVIEVKVSAEEPQAEKNSRFYISRRISFGNVSLFQKEKFKWMIYVRSPALDPDISTYVKKVRFFLHPSYKPFDVIDVSHPPFQLTRDGWGDFPIRMQLHFIDQSNPPVDLIHYIKLDTSRSGLQVSGGEQYCDLELAKDTIFGPVISDKDGADDEISYDKDVVMHDASPASLAAASGQERSEASAVSLSAIKVEDAAFFEGNKATVEKIPQVYKKPDTMYKPQKSHTNDTPTLAMTRPIPKRPIDKVNDSCFLQAYLDTSMYALPPIALLKDADKKNAIYANIRAQVLSFPLLKTDQTLVSKLPYTMATSKREWDAWSSGKRLACEWMRAYTMHMAFSEYIASFRDTELVAFFGVRCIWRYLREIGVVPFVHARDTTREVYGHAPIFDAGFVKIEGRARQFDKRELLLRLRNVKLPTAMLRSDIQGIWNIVRQIHSTAVPMVLLQDDGSEWNITGKLLHALVVVFIQRILAGTRKEGSSVSALDLAAFLLNKKEYSFLDSRTDRDFKRLQKHL